MLLFKTGLADSGLLAYQAERAQGGLQDGAPGFKAGQFLGALDQGFIQNEAGAHKRPLGVGMDFG